MLADSNLTPRETTIVTDLVSGKSYNEIADERFISINTVRHHVRNIYTKTGVSSRAELMAKYYQG